MAPGQMLNLLFLLFIVRAGAQDPQHLEVNGAVGGVAFLTPPGPQNPSEYSRIHWRWKKRVTIASRQRGQEPRYPQSRFRGRLELLENNTLKMSDLRVEDSSDFHLYLQDDTGRESIEGVRLRVYDLVPKPQVGATTTGDSWQCNATLSCSVALEGVTYEWIPAQKLPRNRGPVLSVSFNPTVETYVCRVSNAVSSNSAALTFRPPCTWTGESSSVSGATPSALVALGHLVLLFLLLLVA
ncbi:CD48 antigen-like [Acridotheres tristis]